jgi:hypothetical protein
MRSVGLQERDRQSDHGGQELRRRLGDRIRGGSGGWRLCGAASGWNPNWSSCRLRRLRRSGCVRSLLAVPIMTASSSNQGLRGLLRLSAMSPRERGEWALANKAIASATFALVLLTPFALPFVIAGGPWQPVLILYLVIAPLAAVGFARNMQPLPPLDGDWEVALRHGESQQTEVLRTGWGSRVRRFGLRRSHIGWFIFVGGAMAILSGLNGAGVPSALVAGLGSGVGIVVWRRTGELRRSRRSARWRG